MRGRPRIRTVETSIFSALDENPAGGEKRFSEDHIAIIETWQEFVKQFPVESKLPSFPIWSNEFGATYPYDGATPYSIGLRRLRKYRGSHGIDLSKLTPSERWDALPSYARTEEDEFPQWKVKFIEAEPGSL